MMGQTDLFERRAADGIRRAADHAEEESAGWTLRAATWLRGYARGQAGPFLIEDAREHYPEPPPDSRAWGSATRIAAKQGWIVHAGFAMARSSNRSPKCLWIAP